MRCTDPYCRFLGECQCGFEEREPPRTTFWAPEAEELLKRKGRQDLVDRGDDFAQRIGALVLTAIARLQRFAEEGDPYDGHGGADLVRKRTAVRELERLVEVRMREEMEALESLLAAFGELRRPEAPEEGPDDPGPLPSWY